MSTRGYSPRRYGRSEHAPIVIDMVDYGNDDYADDFNYSSSHYSSPRHAAPSSGSVHSSPRHTTSMGSPRQSSPRHHQSATTTSSTRSSPRSPRHRSSNSSVHSSSSSSPRQSVHMHNFAQRRSFMMGGFEKPIEEQQQEDMDNIMDNNDNNNNNNNLESNPHPNNRSYHHQEGGQYGEYQPDNIEASREREYRQSPGRSRKFQLVDEVDTRDRPVVDTTVNRGRGEGGGTPVSHHDMLKKYQNNNHHHHHGQHEDYSDDMPIYSSVGSRFDNHQHHTAETTSTHQATFPVFDPVKRPEENVFSFDNDVDMDNDLHTVPGITNRQPHDTESAPPVRDSMSVAAPASEKKVFYFDIDDLSQRLLNSGDQDLSRRLRKKKAKNARSRISRNRARRKSKKSVFNLELDGAATDVLHGGDGGGGGDESPVVTTIPEDVTRAAGRFHNQNVASGAGGLFIDTSADIDRMTPDAISQVRSASVRSPKEDKGLQLRRNPSVGSAPAEHRVTTLSPNATMEFDVESIQERAKSNPSSPKEGSPRSRRQGTNNKPKSPKIIEDSGSVTGPDLSRGASPTLSVRAGTSPIAAGGGAESEIVNVNSPMRSGSSEMRVTKVYDEINDRLDHIVSRENDVGNRQKAIRAVFEEVQQHVADLRKHKQQDSLKSEPPADTQDGIVDLVSVSGTPKRSTADDGDDQLIKRRNDSSEVEDVIAKLDQIQRKRGPAVTGTTTQPTAPIQVVSSDGIVVRPSLSKSEKGASEANQDLPGLNVKLDEKEQASAKFDVGGEGAKSQETRPSAYLSSDNSGDDEIVARKESSNIGERNVYVIEEEDGKSVVHVEKESTHTKDGKATSPRSELQKQDALESKLPNSGDAPASISPDQNETEDRLEPDGDRLEPNATKEADNSDVGETLVGLKSKSMESARKRAICGKSIDEEVLDSDIDDDDVAALDIDKEFDRVVPLGDDNESQHTHYNIDETLDRIARQSELEKQEEAAPTKAMTRRDEEEKANALLDSLSNVSLFADEDVAKSPSSMSNKTRGSRKQQSPRHLGESASILNESFIDIEGEDDVSAEKGALDYDYNLAISAATKSCSSSSASDLKEFPMASDKQQYADTYGSASSSNVSSDISESSSDDSMSESSYDSFISIVETEDESDMEFFDDQEGFAENFMSNLVSATFGWMEKKQEQLACGFKSGEPENPSLLRESMIRQKKTEPEVVKDNRNKAMKSIRSAVTSKYGRDNMPLGDKKTKSSSGKKSSRHHHAANGATEDRKRSKRAQSSHAKREGARREDGGVTHKSPAGKASKKKGNVHPEKSERVKQHVADSRKKSLVDDKKESDSDSPLPNITAGGDEKAKTSTKPSKGEGPPLTAKTTSSAPTGDKPSLSQNNSKSTVEQNIGQYNFDILSSDDEEAGGASSVQVIAVHPASSVGKKPKKSSKAKKQLSPDADADSVKVVSSKIKKQTNPRAESDADDSVKVITNVPDQDVQIVVNASPDPEPSKRKSRRPKKDVDKAEVKSPDPPKSGDQARRADPEAAMASLSPPRRRSPSPSKTKASSALVSEKDPVGHLAERKSKRVSSKSKVSKKASKKEKAAAKESAGPSKRRASSHSRRKGTESRGDAVEDKLDDETESDADSMMKNMTEEERENARKERRRASALKRRRKLRERRRAKLEENLTDDTFS